MSILKRARKNLQRYLLGKRTSELVKQLDGALAQNRDNIPVLVVSYNNAVYVRNIVRQLNAFCITPIVIDNASGTASMQILRDIEKSGDASLVLAGRNWGHKVGFLEPVFQRLPNVFAYTDPDLQLNRELPVTFLDDLKMLTEHYRVFKAGFALDLLEGTLIIDSANSSYGGIRSWEAQYWRKPLVHPNLEVWAAEIDTTFAVYNRKYDKGRFFDAVRVGREFAAIHLPWFPELDLFSATQRMDYMAGNKSSAWIR